MIMQFSDMTMTIIVSAMFSVLFLIGVNGKEFTLQLGALVSQEGDVDNRGFLSAMSLALETIKNDTTLPFNFNVKLNDSRVRKCYNR